MTYEDKQKIIREKILKNIELKEQDKKLKAKERYEKDKDIREIERLQKVNAFKEANPGKKLLSKYKYKIGEWVQEEVCQLEEDNIFIIEKKVKQKKWQEIKDWREKMKKAGIKAKPRKYHKPPRDLSIHTHSKCRVPALAKRKGE